MGEDQEPLSVAPDIGGMAEAIDACADGDVILLTDGAFTGDGNRDLDYAGKAITIMSESVDPTLCVIDCDATLAYRYRGFSFTSGEGSGSVLSGVTIHDGCAPIVYDKADRSSSCTGGAILCVDSSPTITNCVFTENRAAYGFGGHGGAVYCTGLASPEVVHCRFTSNSSDNGGAVFCDAGSSVVLKGCTFTGNDGGCGGAVRCRDASLRAYEVVIESNTATVAAGIFSYQTSLDFEKCSFVGNEASSYAGGVYCAGACTATFSDCTFAGNRSEGGGGAVYFNGEECFPAFVNVLFSGNEGGMGGAVFCYDTCAEFDWVTMIGNTGRAGGAVATHGDAAPRFGYSTFADNTATDESFGGAAFYCIGHSDPMVCKCIVAFNEGGAAFECRSYSDARVSWCDVFGNSGGDWVGEIADQGAVWDNMCVDPLFCGDENPGAPYTLHENSPCTEEEQYPGGTIGAWGIGCDPTLVEAVSWGAIKALYR